MARSSGGDGASLGFEHVFEPGDETDPGYTALLLHGTGADQHDLVPLGRTLVPGKPMVSPLGKVREQGMARWFARHGEGVFDEASIRTRARELAGFLPKAAAAYEVPERFVAIGFSNGANIAASLLLLHPDALRGAVLLRAMTPLVPDALADLAGVPVYIASGQYDPLIDAEDAKRLAGMLEDAGADVTHKVHPNAGHGLTQDEIPDVTAWLAEHEETLGSPQGERS